MARDNFIVPRPVIKPIHTLALVKRTRAKWNSGKKEQQQDSRTGTIVG